MPEYLHPGVYIEETSYRGKPIQGVSTSTAGFVGAARKGLVGKAVFVPSYAHFRRQFGDPLAVPADGLGGYLGHAVKAFFDNGGARCWVVRVLAGDALASSTSVEQGTVLRLAPGVTVRGPTATLRLNSLRGVGVGTVLRLFTRSEASSPFALSRTATVQAYDAARGSVSVAAADAIPGGVVLEPANTVILLNGMAPADVAAVGGGPVFSARNPGQDGDRVAVEIRPRDRPPVALVSASARRSDPLIALEPAAYPLSTGQTTLQFSAGALRRLRSGDQISVGGSTGLTVQAIANGDLSFAVAGGSVAADYSGGASLSLVQRGATALPLPIALGAAPPALAIDLSAAGPFGPLTVPHELAGLLRAGDTLQYTGGGHTTRVTLSAVRVAQQIAAGAHLTLAGSGLTSAEAGPAEARITRTSASNPALARLFVGDVSRFSAPARSTSAEFAAVGNGSANDATRVLLVDPADQLVLVERGAAGGFETNVNLDDWRTLEQLQVAADGQTSVRVASTAGFYSGAKVELDSGSAKFEAVVQSVDPAARSISFTSGLALGAGNAIVLAADPAARAAYLRVCELDLLVYEDGVVKESFEGLSWNPDPATDAGLRHYATRLNDAESGSALVSVTVAAAAAHSFAAAPAAADGQPRALSGGDNGSALADNDLIGSDNGPGRRSGIQALAERDDIAMAAVPGVTSETVQAALITHCERLKYRVAVLDAPLSAQDVSALQSHRNHYDSSYAAYYAPWVRALNSSNGRIESFPPSACAMGIYARSDNSVGVHKAPANEVVRNITDLVLPFTAAEQDVLNPVGINLIRDLSPRGLRLWGARTLTSDPEWTYLNVRRLFVYLEHSIDLGTQWVVFEPNSEALWARVTATINAFLFGVWKSGALMGTTPQEAYFITCDRTSMTQDDIDNGRLVCLIGIAPVKPAEFVIFRIGQFTATVA